MAAPASLPLVRDGKIDTLLITGGHPFESAPFFAVFDADPGLSWLHAKQPGARQFFDPRVADLWDAFVFYDMSGIMFRDVGSGGQVVAESAPANVVIGFNELCDAGHGFVFLHHSIASWPAWPGYGEALGGRFLYGPGTFAGAEWPDSGYRDDTWHHVTVVEPHPITAGLGDGFDITDDVFCMAVDESRIRPLMRSDYDFEHTNFSSSALAIQGRRGRRDGWSHPRGSNAVVWTVPYRNTEIVYIQCGAGPSAYANAGFRRLLANAIRWVSRHRSGGPALPYPG